MTSIDVRAAAPYQVHIGHGLLEQVSHLVEGATRTAIIHAPVLSDQAHHLADLVPGPVLVPVAESEAAKTPESLVECWARLAEAGLTRNDVVIGLGGGATTDLAGFVAATWLRGVRFVSIPSTVLGMVDAAVGGKTGINIPAGKNLVGAFHEPVAVLCDLDLLTTLPEADTRAGLAEAIKAGFISDTRILELVDQDPDEATNPSSVRFGEIMRRAIQVKADVVSADLREATSTGSAVGREALNYGHTLGHAIEKVDQFGWRHGEAISIGMVFAAELSRASLGLPDDVVAQHRDLLTRVGLPISYNAASWAQLRQTMALDKKSRGATLRFVGLRALGQVEMIVAPDEGLLEQCFTALDPNIS